MWKNPTANEGNEVLQKHYNWITLLKTYALLLLSGPTDIELTSTGIIKPVEHSTGLIMFNIAKRDDAEKWAFQDSFHQIGFRRNRVYSMKISVIDEVLCNTINKQINESAN